MAPRQFPEPKIELENKYINNIITGQDSAEIPPSCVWLTRLDLLV